MSELIKKLTISSGGTSTASVKDMQDQMGLLAEFAPQWCTIVTIDEEPAVRLNNNVRFPEVQKMIQQHVEAADKAAEKAKEECAV